MKYNIKASCSEKSNLSLVKPKRPNPPKQVFLPEKILVTETIIDVFYLEDHEQIPDFLKWINSVPPENLKFSFNHHYSDENCSIEFINSFFTKVENHQYDNQLKEYQNYLRKYDKYQKNLDKYKKDLKKYKKQLKENKI